MHRLRFLLCALLLAACASQAPTPENLRNAPTLPAPTQFVEVQQPITLNNIANAQYVGRLDPPGTLSTVFSYAVSPDATRLVGLNNELMLAWSLLDGSLLFQTSRANATRVFYSPDKTEIYAVDRNGVATAHDANTGGVKTSFQGSPDYANATAYAADFGWLALGGSNGAVKVWDTYARQSLVTISAHSGAITALALSADGEQLATAGEDGIVRVWRWRDQTMLGETKLDKPIAIRQLAFAPDGSALAVGTDRDARLWSLTNTRQIDALDTGRGGANERLTFSPDGRLLLAGNRSAGLSVWTLADKTLTARLPDTSGDTLAAAFSPDGTLLITAVLKGKVLLWNLVQMTGENLNQAELPVGTQQIVSVEWTDDSRLILFFDASGTIYLWGVEG